MKVIDIHVHGIKGYDASSGKEEDIVKIAEILGAHGISKIILTIYPSSIEEMRQSMIVVKKAMERQREILNPFSSFLSKREYRGGRGEISDSEFRAPNLSLILGVHLEGPFLNPSKCGVLNKKAFIEPKEHNFRRLIEGFEDIVKIITIAPEIKGALKLIKKISDMGIIVSMGHSEATFSEAEGGFNAGARGITHIFNAMRGFYHREPGIAGFGLINKNIYIEVIADPFHLHQKTLELIFNLKNSEKIIIVSDSVKETRVGIKEKIRRRVKAIIGRNNKLIGGSMTVIESAKRLIQKGFNEENIMKCITVNPESYLSLR